VITIHWQGSVIYMQYATLLEPIVPMLMVMVRDIVYTFTVIFFWLTAA